VPRFFFHIFDDAVSRDDEGLELADADAARRAGMAGIRAMICDQVKQGRLSLHHRIEVEEEGVGPLLTLAFADAVEIEPQA
jgi:hypothetical protein